MIFPQLFCTVCAISAVISNFPHVFTDNIYLLNMSKKETPRIFLYRISPQISLQKYTWVSFFKICQVLFVCAHQKKPVCWQTTRSRELLPHGFTDCFPYKPACAYHKFFTYAKRCFHIISYAPWFVNQCFNKNTLPYTFHAFLIRQSNNIMMIAHGSLTHWNAKKYLKSLK